MGCVALVAGSAVPGRDSGRKPGNNAAAVARGKTIFQQKCTVCHYDNSDQKKIGPGLKGISKRGTFSVNGNKITDEKFEDVDRKRRPIDAADSRIVWKRRRSRM